MSEKSPRIGWLEKRKIEKSNETRIHDPAKAEEMAYAEKPHREKAIQQRKVGKALVKQTWANYPNFDKEKVITAAEVADRTKGEISDADIVARSQEGIVDLRTRVSSRTATSERSAERRQNRVDELTQTNPAAIPDHLAQKVGYELQDTSAPASIEAANRAGELAGTAYDEAQAENARLFAEDFDRAHGTSPNSRPPVRQQ